MTGVVESIVFKEEPTGPEAPKTEEAKKVETPKTEEKTNEQRPEWMPEGFTGTAEDLKKSWADMRAEITRLQQQAKKPAEEKKPEAADEKKPEEKPAEEQKKDETDEAAKKVGEAANFDFAPFEEEFNTTGDISAENRAKIAEGLKGVLGDKALSAVEDFIEGKKALRDNYRSEVLEPVGGEEGYTRMTAWAAQNLPREDIDAYNKAVDSGDASSARLAVQGLFAKYQAANGVEPDLIGGDTPAGDTVGYASVFEMQQAMSKKNEQGQRLYKVDPVYRAKVEQKVKLSRF